MNLVNTEATPIHRVMALIRDVAARHGARVQGCEVVGLIPEAAMLDVAEHALQLENFRRDQVLELRLKTPPLTEAVTLSSFFDSVAGPTPTPGGGTVAATVGALAAALATMVANLTIGKKKHAAAEPAMRELKQKAEVLRRRLMELARSDSEAFDAVLRARRLPQATPQETEARERAIRTAEIGASRVPLETAEACTEVLQLAAMAAKSGNPNAVSDAGVAGLLAHASAEGALYNVKINLKSLSPGADKEDVENGLRRIAPALEAADRACRAAVHAVLDA
jgi:glutamate formiminotransferase/formiminotetrahydrofolate cyclodeaminase